MFTVDLDVRELAGREEIYCRLSDSAPADYRDTWRLFAANESFRRELDRAARHLARTRGMRGDRVPDIVNEALLVLADRLRSRGNLGFDTGRGQGRFLAWLRAVARSHCRHALQRQRGGARRHFPLDREWPEPTSVLAAQRADLAEAVESLSEPLRAVVDAFGEFGSIKAVARRLGLSQTTAWRRYRAAVARLRPRCGGYVASGRLTGLENVAQKW